jgi:hypothetical protein
MTFAANAQTEKTTHPGMPAFASPLDVVHATAMQQATSGDARGCPRSRSIRQYLPRSYPPESRTSARSVLKVNGFREKLAASIHYF